MGSITYLDPDKEAPLVTIKGIAFKAGEAVDTDDADLLERLAEHPHFKVDNGKPAPTSPIAPKPAAAAAKK